MTPMSRLLAAAAVSWTLAAGAAAQSPANPAPAAAAPAVARVRTLAPRIEQNLRENVIPFWFPRCVDTVNGGYTVHYGPKGEPLPGGVKMIVTRAAILGSPRRCCAAAMPSPGCAPPPIMATASCAT